MRNTRLPHFSIAFHHHLGISAVSDKVLTEVSYHPSVDSVGNITFSVCVKWHISAQYLTHPVYITSNTHRPYHRACTSYFLLAQEHPKGSGFIVRNPRQGTSER